ncbi:MAG: NAD(P)H-hydrate dehydratase [bacterium]|nr:NAD(P)H-hydrate dehydratase [bacterium]
MKILSSKEMYEVDRKSTETYGIPDSVLMENAGIGIARFIRDRFPGQKQVLVLAGPGNNGGDGLVCARHLFRKGYSVRIFLIGDEKKQTANNKKNFQMCRKLKIPIHVIHAMKDLDQDKNILDKSLILVDSILGLGLKTPLTGALEEIVRYLNTLTGKIKISADIPTGLSADHFIPEGIVFKADITITFGAPKISHLFSPARESIGELVCLNIGFPGELLEESRLKMNCLTSALVKEYLPERRKVYHKNDYGHVAVFAGSTGKAGAASLCSEAVLRSGAGLVTTVCPIEINPVLQACFREGMTFPVDMNDPQRALEQSRELLEKADVIVAGCGIGTSKPSRDFLSGILGMNNKTVILDADALNIIAGEPDLLKKQASSLVLTPHLGEFGRLVKMEKEQMLRDIFSIARDFSRQYGCILVLKSSETMVVAPDSSIFVNTIGNDGMATAGSGDVLSGIIAGLASQNIKQKKSLLGSVLAAVYIHSLAGDEAVKVKGKFSLLAGDLISCLPQAFEKILS